MEKAQIKKSDTWSKKVKKAYNKGKFNRRGGEVNISIQKNMEVVV